MGSATVVVTSALVTYVVATGCGDTVVAPVSVLVAGSAVGVTSVSVIEVLFVVVLLWGASTMTTGAHVGSLSTVVVFPVVA